MRDGFSFSLRQRVRYAETDAQAIVYHANYLIYAEVGRSAFLRELGLDRDRMMSANNVELAIGEAWLRYRAPLRYEEEFDIWVRVGEVRRSTWTFEYEITRLDGTLCAEITTTLVQIDSTTHRATRVIEPVRELLLKAGGRPAAS